MNENIYAAAKNFHCSRQRPGRTPTIQNFRRTCSLRMTTPCVVHTTDATNNMARRVPVVGFDFGVIMPTVRYNAG